MECNSLNIHSLPCEIDIDNILNIPNKFSLEVLKL